MPKSQSPKVNSSICNIHISETKSNFSSLLRPGDSNGVINIELKKKVVCRLS